MSVITQRTDSQIKADVLRELDWDPRIEETEVGVQVRDGIVTLTGKVSHYATCVAAEKAAHRVKGVLDVANELEVHPPSSSVKSDREMAEAVRRALKWDVFVPDEKIRSTVEDGWVTLEGEVRSMINKRDAARAIERLYGVRGVTNNIVVIGALPPAGSTEIQTAIEGALERRALREAHRVRVSVHDGVATLEGPVSSWGERHAVEQVAAYAPGVRRIESRLVVDPYI